MEQEPVYNIVTLSDGVNEKLQIYIKLPGVHSALEFSVKIQDGFLLLHVPGRFKLDLPLNVAVADDPEELKFVKSRSELKAVLPILGGAERGEHNTGGHSTGERSGGRSSDSGGATPPVRPTPPTAVHDSFAADAARLVASKRKAKSHPGRPRPVQYDPINKPSVPSTDDEQNKGTSFEAYERPKRRNRPREKPTLSGFVKSSYRDKDRSGPTNQGHETVDSDLEASIATPSVSEERKGTPQDRESDQEEESQATPPPHFSQSVSEPREENNLTQAQLDSESHGSTSDSFRGPPEVNTDWEESADRAGKAIADNILQSILSERSAYFPPVQDRENDHTWGPTVHSDLDASVSDTSSDDEGSMSASKSVRSDFASNPHPNGQIPQPGSARGAPQGGSRPPWKDQTADGGDKDWGRKESPRGFTAEERGSTARGARDPSAAPLHGRSNSRAPKGDGFGLRGRRSASTTPRHANKPNNNSRSNKKKVPRREEDHIPAFHPPPPQPKTEPGDFFKMAHQKGVRFERSLAYRRKPRGTVQKALEEKFVKFMILLARAYYFCDALSKWTIVKSPDLLIAVAAKFGLADHSFFSPADGSDLNVRAILAFLTVVLLAVFFAVLFVPIITGILFWLWDLAWWTLGTALWLTFKILKLVVWSIPYCLLWEPSIYLALPATLLMRYGYMIVGPVKLAQIGVVMYGAPMMVWSLTGGFSGLCSLAICLLATLWGVSHFDVMVILGFLTRIFDSLHWTPIITRPLTLLLSIAYLFLRGKLIFGKQRGSYSDAPVEDLPEGAEGEIARVLQAKDFYEVLEVGPDFEADDLRRAKRKLALATHPDKQKQQTSQGASQAFSRVTEAYEVLSKPSSRAEYDRELQNKAILEDLDSYNDDLQENGIGFFCPYCTCEHQGVITTRSLKEARWCSQCRTYHPAKNGDGWHESSGFLNQKVKMFICVDNAVWDMTEWADCVLRTKKVPVNTHEVQYKFGVKGEGGSESGTPRSATNPRSRKKTKQRNKR